MVTNEVEGVGDGVIVGVREGLGVFVGVGVLVGVGVRVSVEVDVGVCVAVGEGVCEGVGVAEENKEKGGTGNENLGGRPVNENPTYINIPAIVSAITMPAPRMNQ